MVALKVPKEQGFCQVHKWTIHINVLFAFLVFKWYICFICRFGNWLGKQLAFSNYPFSDLVYDFWQTKHVLEIGEMDPINLHCGVEFGKIKLLFRQYNVKENENEPFQNTE